MKLTILTGATSPEILDNLERELEGEGHMTISYPDVIEVWSDHPGEAVAIAKKYGLEAHEAIRLTHPGEINKPHIRQRIEMLADLGFRSSNIILALNFVCDNPGKIADKFKVIKNRVYHAKAIEKAGQIVLQTKGWYLASKRREALIKAGFQVGPLETKWNFGRVGELQQALDGSGFWIQVSYGIKRTCAGGYIANACPVVFITVTP